MSRHREYRNREWSYDEYDEYEEEDEEVTYPLSPSSRRYMYRDGSPKQTAASLSAFMLPAGGNADASTEVSRPVFETPPRPGKSTGSKVPRSPRGGISISGHLGAAKVYSMAASTPPPPAADSQADREDVVISELKKFQLDENGACSSKERTLKTTASAASSTTRIAEQSAATSSSGSKRLNSDGVHARVNYDETDTATMKPLLTMVVVGHVDAGKSTLMGHLLCDLGYVSQRTLHKYEKEARSVGKASFAFAWVLDAHDEERTRGVTMDVGVSRFETEHRRVMLLDAPGHRDFIPNMISGAAQADVAVIVVPAAGGEFEAGFQSTGQTREHALLLRYLGVKQLVVAVNKMDTCGWSQSRYDEIVGTIVPFLCKIGFSESEIRHVPVSGLSGENLGKRGTEPTLTNWYSGPSLVDLVDTFRPAGRPAHKPFRMCVADVYRSKSLGGLTVGGKIEAGFLATGDKVVLCPLGESCAVKAIQRCGDGATVRRVRAGENVEIGLVGIDPSMVTTGSILAHLRSPVPVVKECFEAQIMTFPALRIPLLRGASLMLHLQSIETPVTVTRLVRTLGGAAAKESPRCIRRGETALVLIRPERTLCLEAHENCRPLARFLLRTGGQTVAAGICTVVNPPSVC